jgi:hypothetical protein
MKDRESPAPPNLRTLVWKSALLNLGIILTTLPVLVAAGGPRAIVPTLVIVGAVSAVVWTSTFAIFAFVSLYRIFQTQLALGTRTFRNRSVTTGVDDKWLDGSA